MQKSVRNEPKMWLYLLIALTSQVELPELEIGASPYFLFDKKCEECLQSQPSYFSKEPKLLIEIFNLKFHSLLDGWLVLLPTDFIFIQVNQDLEV